MSNQSINVGSLLAAFGDADPNASSGGAPKIEIEGEHIVKLQEIKFKPSEKDDNTYFIVEFELIQSVCPGLTIGTTYGWSHNLNNKWYGIPNAKQFIAAALGLDPTSSDAKGLELHHVYQVLGMAGANDTVKPGPQQPLTGRLLGLRTTPGESSNGKYTKHRWAPYIDAATPLNFG